MNSNANEILKQLKTWLIINIKKRSRRELLNSRLSSRVPKQMEYHISAGFKPIVFFSCFPPEVFIILKYISNNVCNNNC